jgi:hypothetical protein
MNQWVLRTTLPSASMEFSHDWKDRAAMGVPFVFDRVLFMDRSAAMNGDSWLRTQRTASEAFALPGSPNWWSTVRNSVIEYTGLNASTGAGTRGRPVITYISRQEWGRRMLIQQDHDKLVEELYKLRDQYGYEVNVVSMDKLSRVEQLSLAGRTTVCVSLLSREIKPLIANADHDGCAREWLDIVGVDEAYTTLYRHGVLLSWWFRLRLRIHDARTGYGSFWLLGEQVLAFCFPSSRAHQSAQLLHRR